MKLDSDRRLYCKKVLRHSPLFSGLPETVLDDMLLMFRPEHWQRGVHLDSSIFQQRFHLLIEGRVEVMRIHPETGRSITLFILGPGDALDVMSLLDTQPHEIASVGLDDVALISVPVQTARDWISHHPAFNRNFLPYLAGQMRQMEDLAVDLALYHTMARLARLILRHVVPHQRQSVGDAYHLSLIHDLHDDALARMVGSVRQVVNRHLQHWRKRGVLQRQGFSTEVMALDALKVDARESARDKKNKR